jgi:hypothetical protein
MNRSIPHRPTKPGQVGLKRLRCLPPTRSVRPPIPLDQIDLGFFDSRHPS